MFVTSDHMNGNNTRKATWKALNQTGAKLWCATTIFLIGKKSQWGSEEWETHVTSTLKSFDQIYVPRSNLFRRIKEKGKGFLKAGFSRLMVMMV